MPEKKKKPVDKKSAAYMRPQPGSFTLESMPGKTFRFKKPDIEDLAWCVENLGMHPLKFVKQDKTDLKSLCRLYFRYLDELSKAEFAPKTYEQIDESGVKTEETIGGWRRLMKDITGGHTEVLAMGHAFLLTLISFRPLEEFSDEEKKSLGPLLEQIYANAGQPKAAAQPEPGPMGSQVVDLRPGKEV